MRFPLQPCENLGHTVHHQGLIDSMRRGHYNFHSDCTVGKILIVAKNSDKCMGGAIRQAQSSACWCF